MWIFINVLCCITFLMVTAAQRHYDLVFEKLEKVLVDKTYLDPGTLRVTRVNRTHTVISGEFEVFETVDDEVKLTILTYEKPSGTEYKRSAAISLKNKPICSFINSDTLGVRDFKKSTNLPDECPVPPGKYTVKNYVLDPEKFPSHIPGSNWRGDVFIFKDDINWIHLQLYIRVEQKGFFG